MVATPPTSVMVVQSDLEPQQINHKQNHVRHWLESLENIRQDQQSTIVSDSKVPPMVIANDGAQKQATSAVSARAVSDESKLNIAAEESDDDLEADLAIAGLEAGAKAFDAQEWEEATSLYQEALHVLQKIPKHQRAFCNVFDLQYKLAICTYHTRESAEAEEALISLVQQQQRQDISAAQQEEIYRASHLLSHLYIQMGQAERAQATCEKALQGRRRLLGKQSDAALESIALMAHVSLLLDNRPRAKFYMTMIPEARRHEFFRNTENSLRRVIHSDLSPLRKEVILESQEVPRVNRRFSTASSDVYGESFSGKSQLTSAPQSPTAGSSTPCQPPPAVQTNLRTLQYSGVHNGINHVQADQGQEGIEVMPQYSKILEPALNTSQTINSFYGKTLSRKEILENIGCQPRSSIEEAVFSGDQVSLARLLNKKRSFWQAKIRKRARSERVTALHFAALFGEIMMAEKLIGVGYDVNEVPFGYSTSLTPLTFAIGARKVEMVEFLIKHGAKPSAPDSWSTLAGQLMNQSWLKRTMSESERESVSGYIIAIMNILLLNGWEINTPFEKSGRTVLHQVRPNL